MNDVQYPCRRTRFWVRDMVERLLGADGSRAEIAEYLGVLGVSRGRIDELLTGR